LKDASFHKNWNLAGTPWARLRTNQKAVVLKLGLILNQQSTLTKNNFTVEPIPIFAPG